MKLQDISSDQLLEELKSRGYLVGDSPMTSKDVQEMAYSNNLDLEPEQIDLVCKAINKSHTPEEGINWWVIDASLKAFVGYNSFASSTI